MQIKCYMFEVGKTYSIDGPVSNAMDNEVGRQFTVKQRNDRSTVVTNPLAKKPGYISMAMVFEKVADELIGYEILVLPKDTWGNDVKIKMTENGAARVMPKVKKEKKAPKSELKTELVEGGQQVPEENTSSFMSVDFTTNLVNNGEVLNDEENDEAPVAEETVEVAAKVEPKSKKSKAKRKK